MRLLYLVAGVAILLCLGLCAAVSMGMSRQLFAPIRALNSAMEEVERGNLDARVEPRGADEMAQLAGRFNRMTRRLEEKGDLLSGVSIAAGWWKWEGTGGRIYLETSVGTWRAFRCVLGESGKMGMIQLRQEGRPHDLADCTQFYPVD